MPSAVRQARRLSIAPDLRSATVSTGPSSSRQPTVPQNSTVILSSFGILRSTAPLAKYPPLPIRAMPSCSAIAPKYIPTLPLVAP